MLNAAFIEGYVTSKIWHWGGDLFFRLAAYRDPHLPQKPVVAAGTHHDQAADYVTVRVINGATGGLPVAVRAGQRVRVHGFLGSRPWRRTLAEVARAAQGEPVTWGQGCDPARTVLEDEVIDVIAERIVTLDWPPAQAGAP